MGNDIPVIIVHGEGSSKVNYDKVKNNFYIVEGKNYLYLRVCEVYES